MRKRLVLTALGLSMLGVAAMPARAEDTIKIGYVDPLSGGLASVGMIGLNEVKFAADMVNAKGGVLGKKVEIVGLDDKVDPQVALVQVQNAIDQGISIIIQGNGSSVGSAIEDFVTKYNDRNPGKEVVYLNYGAIDPKLTNEKCSYWHFSFDASVTVKMEALVNFIKPRQEVKKVYLIDQDYSFGHSVADTAVLMLKEKRPDVEVVGNEFVPLGKVTDFSPYIAKINASGADTVITGNWGQDLALLFKAAGDAGLKVKWYTYYADLTGGPTAIKQANLPDSVFVVKEGFSNQDYKPAQDTVRTYVARFPDQPIFYPKVYNLTGMLFRAIAEANSEDPAKFVPKLDGMKYATFSSGEEGLMRADDHQFFQPLYMGVFGPLSAKETFDEEHTSWGWKSMAEVPVDDTIVPTICKMKRPN